MNFDRVARHYWWMERLVFGRALENCRFAFLPALADCRRVLCVGEGDGRFSAELLRRYPDVMVDAIEPSGKMRELAPKRVRFVDRPGTDYDMIVAHFVFDTLTPEEAAALINEIQRTSPKARWIISEFHPRGHATALLTQIMYAFFCWTAGLQVRQIPPYEDELRRAEYALSHQWSAWNGYIMSQLWEHA